MSLHVEEIPQARKVAQLGDPNKFTAMDARDLMIAICEAEDEREHVKGLKESICLRYEMKEDRLTEEIQRMREMMENFITRVNGGEPASYPDLGVAYMSKRPDSLAVVDEADFLAWAEQEGFKTVDAQMARSEARHRLKDLGSVAPGCEVVAGAVGLTIRRAQ